MFCVGPVHFVACRGHGQLEAEAARTQKERAEQIDDKVECSIKPLCERTVTLIQSCHAVTGKTKVGPADKAGNEVD